MGMRPVCDRQSARKSGTGRFRPSPPLGGLVLGGGGVVDRHVETIFLHEPTSYLVRSLRRTMDTNDVPSDVAEKVIRLIVNWEKAPRDDERRDD